MTAASSPSTLVIHSGGIGDFLLMCPSLVGLGGAGLVEVAGRLERVQLAVAGGLARKAHDLDALDFASIFSSPSVRLRRSLAPFERVVVWMRDDEGLIHSGLSEAGVRDVRVFPGLPPAGWRAHASEYYLDCLGGNRDRIRSPLLSVPPAPTQRDVIVHCGSGGTTKNWPLERYVATAQRLAQLGRSVTWCVGPAENSIRLPSDASVIRVDALTELAAILAAATLYIGNDSGISHLAAAVGCPAVVIFGPTEATLWAPMGECVRVVQGAPWPSVDDALEAVHSILG
ncbi:MAG: hypothetical protein HZB26_02730 [Candidatus Hydrogenedentes bacterium]|nr:hypothetical protein [Candidatus Hydrogenedentota bacterium]